VPEGVKIGRASVWEKCLDEIGSGWVRWFIYRLIRHRGSWKLLGALVFIKLFRGLGITRRKIF
jgi:hypothetical protein